MKKEFLKLEDLTAYQIASKLGDYVWEIVSKWDTFARNIIGCQFLRSIIFGRERK